MVALSFEYTPDFRDVFAASAALGRHRYPSAKRLKLTAISFGAMVAGGLLAGIGGSVINIVVPTVPDWVGMGALFGLVGLFYFKVLIPWMQRASADIITNMRPPGLLRFTADDMGLRWKDSDIDFHLGWNRIEAIFAPPGSIGFMSGAVALVLPQSCFAGHTALADFLREALEKLSPAAALRSRSDPAMQRLLAG